MARKRKRPLVTAACRDTVKAAGDDVPGGSSPELVQAEGLEVAPGVQPASGAGGLDDLLALP